MEENLAKYVAGLRYWACGAWRGRSRGGKGRVGDEADDDVEVDDGNAGESAAAIVAAVAVVVAVDDDDDAIVAEEVVGDIREEVEDIRRASGGKSHVSSSVAGDSGPKWLEAVAARTFGLDT